MINFRNVALVTASVFALMATPAAAGCFEDTSKTLVQWQKNAGLAQPGPVALRTALEEGAGSLEQGITNASTHISSGLPTECRGEIADQNIRAYLGLSESAEPAPKPAVTQSAPQAAPTASAVEGKPVTEVAAAPAAKTEGKVSDTAIQRDISAGRSKATAYFARPAAERDPKRDTEMADLLNKINKLEELLGQFPKDKDGNIDIAKLTPTQQTELLTTQTEVRIASSRIEEIVGRDGLDLLTVLACICVVFLGFITWLLRGRVTSLEVNQQDIRENFASNAALAVVDAKAEAANSRFNHVVMRTPLTPKPSDMKAFADGNTFAYPLIVDGEEVRFGCAIVQHSALGEAVVKVDELSKPVTASKLFATLADYIEQGGTAPKLKVVGQS